MAARTRPSACGRRQTSAANRIQIPRLIFHNFGKIAVSVPSFTQRERRLEKHEERKIPARPEFCDVCNISERRSSSAMKLGHFRIFERQEDRFCGACWKPCAAGITEKTIAGRRNHGNATNRYWQTEAEGTGR